VLRQVEDDATDQEGDREKDDRQVKLSDTP
jgi:hypothetical protein